MLRLLTTPIRIGLSVTGRVLGVVRSAVSGDDSREDSPARTPTPATRAEPAPTATSPAETSPAASGTAEAASPTAEDEAPLPPGASDPDDLTLLDRVKTEIFRPGDAEKGSVNVSVENGVVYLRGDVDDPEQAEYFEVAAAEVEGVVRVENLIGSSA